MTESAFAKDKLSRSEDARQEAMIRCSGTPLPMALVGGAPRRHRRQDF